MDGSTEKDKVIIMGFAPQVVRLAGYFLYFFGIKNLTYI